MVVFMLNHCCSATTFTSFISGLSHSLMLLERRRLRGCSTLDYLFELFLGLRVMTTTILFISCRLAHVLHLQMVLLLISCCLDCLAHRLLAGVLHTVGDLRQLYDRFRFVLLMMICVTVMA